MNTKAAKAEQAEAQTGTSLAVIDYGADVGGGLENVSQDELTLPALAVLQTNSPQVDSAEAAYIEGAKVGDIVNLATGDLYKELEMIACHRDHNYVEKVPRTAGGGFVGIRLPDDELVLHLKAKQGKFGKLITSNNNEIQETFYIYGQFREPGGNWFRALMRFKSTQIKIYTGYMNIATTIKYPNGDNRLVQPPMWAHVWKVTTVPDSNKKGKFHSWDIEPLHPKIPGTTPYIKSRLRPDDPSYIAGREFNDLIKAGRVVVKHDDREPGQDDEMPM